MAGVGSHRNERTAEDILHVERLLAAGHEREIAEKNIHTAP